MIAASLLAALLATTPAGAKDTEASPRTADPAGEKVTLSLRDASARFSSRLLTGSAPTRRVAGAAAPDNRPANGTSRLSSPRRSARRC